MSNQYITGRVKPRPVAERFWEKVDKSGECWLWTASLGSTGYGQFVYNGKPRKAHRIAWLLTHGSLSPSIKVLHNCPGGDNPRCCNPAHLFLGTQADNMRDMAAKGRHHAIATPGLSAAGESHPAAKVTASIVQEIRRLYDPTKRNARILARQFGLSTSATYCIIYRQTWRNVA